MRCGHICYKPKGTMVGSRPCWLALEGSGSHWPYVGNAPPFQTQQDFPLPWGGCSQPIKKDLPVNGIQALTLIQSSVGCSSLHRAPGTHGGVAGPGEGGTPSLAPGGSGVLGKGRDLLAWAEPHSQALQALPWLWHDEQLQIHLLLEWILVEEGLSFTS